MTKRKDGRYQKSVTIDGKRVFFYSSEATERKALKDIEKQMIEYSESKDKGKSFVSIAEKWNAEYRERISIVNYNKNSRAAYNVILDYFSGYNQITDVKAKEINVFLSKLIAKKYSKKTISNYKNIINMIFNFAILHGYIEYNPVRDIRLPNNLPKKARDIPSDEEIKKVDSAHEGFALLPYFLLYTGLRLSEALALEYSDIDFENKTVKIDKHLVWNGNHPQVEYRTKTESGKRDVILVDRLIGKLPHNKSGIVFARDDGTYHTKCSYRKAYEKYQKEYGITITAHQLRHAYATMLFEAGIDVKDAQSLMGHSDINLTRQIYTHLRDKRKDETVNKLNDFNF